jgi:hypothetical protein
MDADETQMQRGKVPGQPQNDFNRDPREPCENVLTPSHEGAKKRKSNHGLP